MAFAHRLKALRQAAGLTQQKLANAAGLQREAIARLELGTREPTWATVQAIAAALSVSCEAFADAAQTNVSDRGTSSQRKAAHVPPRKKRVRPKRT